MPVDRLKTDKYSSDKEYAQRSARANIEFVCANIKFLKRGKDVQAALDFKDQKDSYTPGQISYIEGLYEKVFAGANYSACNLHIDKKKKGLRF